MIARYRPPVPGLLLGSLAAISLLLAACQGSRPPAQPSPTPTLPHLSTPTLSPSPTPTLAPSPTPALSPSPTTAAPTIATPADPASLISGDEAYRHVLALADDIGSRTAGSEAEAAAADYIAGQLASYGYDATLEPFEMNLYVEPESALEVLSPEPVSLEPRALRLSAAGDATGELTAAGLGGPQDFPAEGITGRVALLERGELNFSDKVANAAAAGAVAVIIYNDEEGAFRGDLEEESSIPAVGVSQAEGQRLLALLASGPVTVLLSVQGGGPQTDTSRNVVARPPDGRCEEVVAAHYDSVEAGPGANDNASGTAVLLETARVLAASGDGEGVCFVAFGAEEVGLFGSRSFVDGLSADERQALRGMVNVDMVGVGDQWQLFGSEGLVQDVDGEATSLGLDPAPAEAPTGLSSDYRSFMDADIPAVLIHRVDDTRYHSSEDRAQFVKPQALQEAAELTLLTLRLLGQP